MIAVAVVACQPKNKQVTGNSNANNADLHTLTENYYEDRLKLYPLEASQIADPRYNDLLPNDISEGFRKEANTFYQKYLNEINTFKRDSLTENDKITFDVFKLEMERNIEGFNYPDHYTPFTQFGGLPLTMGQLGSGKSFQPFKTVKAYDDFLKRIHAFSVWSDTRGDPVQGGARSVQQGRQPRRRAITPD